MTSTLPASPPTPSTETKAYLLSGEITTPCGMFVDVLILEICWPLSRDQIETAP